MKNSIFSAFLFIFLIGCKATSEIPANIKSVAIDTLMTGKFSIRALAVNDGKIYYATNKNRIGFIYLDERLRFERKINPDSLVTEFRSIAVTDQSVCVVNAGNPAFLYRFSKDFEQPELVYEEHHEKVFYDSMRFWNDREGIAIGDPTANCFSILITRDGGKTWNKTPCANLPELAEGEAAFAASNTNIAISGNHAWVVSGGKKARVFHSSDKGKTWTVYDTPIVQGEVMTGIFTADFYNSKIGFIAGGNYEKQAQNFQNKALTADGGETWKLVGEHTGFGYASCIQFVPQGNGKELVCVGSSGIYHSRDSGTTWQQLSTDGTLFTIRFADKNTAIAAGKDKMIRIIFNR